MKKMTAVATLMAVLVSFVLTGVTVQAKEPDCYYEDNVKIIDVIKQGSDLKQSETGEFFEEAQYVAESMVYVVQKGDTLSKIASYFGMSINKISMLNPQIKDLNLIIIGEEIQLYCSEFYPIAIE